MPAESNNGTIFMLLGGAALLYWFMSQQSDDAIRPVQQGTPVSKGPFPVSSTTPPVNTSPVPETKNPASAPPAAFDPIVPLPARLVRIAGSGSQNVDEWNWHYQHGIANGAEQPDPDTFMPAGYDRSQAISATDYVRYRGLGRASGNRYQAQASRIVRQSTF